MSRRIARVNELLKREIATELYRVMNESGFDMAAVTVTRVITSPDLRHARVMVSVRGDPDTGQRMLSLMGRHRKAIQHDINKRTSLKYTPHLDFQLDTSIEQGDHVLAIIAEMEQAEIDNEEEDAPAEEPYE